MRNKVGMRRDGDDTTTHTESIYMYFIFLISKHVGTHFQGGAWVCIE